MKVYISDQIQNQLEILADLNHVTVSQLVDRVVNDWLTEMEVMTEYEEQHQVEQAYEHSLSFI